MIKNRVGVMPALFLFFNINLSNFNKNILTNGSNLHIMGPKNRELEIFPDNMEVHRT